MICTLPKDMILLLFDVSKLDISDEFRRLVAQDRHTHTDTHTCINLAGESYRPPKAMTTKFASC